MFIVQWLNYIIYYTKIITRLQWVNECIGTKFVKGIIYLPGDEWLLLPWLFWADPPACVAEGDWNDWEPFKDVVVGGKLKWIKENMKMEL